ncbi:MAG: hypothetical protein EOO17_00820 [Chloroflexi bacterium]|nr:MAG: hypothetical protein EOO17_00820 [Chloroflexota bacterium]
MTKPETGKDILNEAKNKIKKQKETTNMKTPKKTIIVTVLLTLTTIAIIAGLLYAGFTAGISYEKSKNHEVTTAAKELAVQVAPIKK